MVTKAILKELLLSHECNWVVLGALLEVCSQPDGAAWPYVAIRRLPCILKKHENHR